MGIWVGIAWLVVGVAVGVLGWAWSSERLRPRHWAGLRLASTQRSDHAWYAAHAAGGPILQGGGALVATAGFLLVLFRPVEQSVLLVSMFLAVGLLGGLIGAVVVAVRAARDVVEA